jgi:amino acid adenylation domain-containing protein
MEELSVSETERAYEPVSHAHGHGLALAQEAVWLGGREWPGLSHGNVGWVQPLDVIDVVKLRAAVQHVADSHDALRMVVMEGPGVLAVRQCVRPTVAVALAEIDMSGQARAEQRARKHMQQALQAPFEAFGDLLWEMQLIRTGGPRGYLMFRGCRLMADDAANVLIHRAVLDAYGRLLQGGRLAPVQGPSCLEGLRLEAAYLASQACAGDEAFWRERLAVPRAPLFPPQRPAQEAVPGDPVVWRMPPAFFARVEQQALAQGGSATHFLLAALAVCFGRTHADGGEVVIGLERTNRHTVRQQACIGALARLMPVGIQLEAQDDFAASMRRVADELHRCARHEQFPVLRLHQAAGAEGRLFDLSLSVREAAVAAANGRLAPVLHAGLQGAPLALVLRPGTGRAGGMWLEFHFDSAVLERAQVERIQQRVALLSQAVVKGARGPVCALPLMSDDERRQVMVAWNDTARDYPQDLCIHELFEQQAARTPQAPAVEYEGKSLSYRELNMQANRLAHHLRGLGVGPDERVAVCVRRGPEMVVAILAVLKAGGAYVPLDPDYPSERLQYMLADSAPRVLLTQAGLCGPLELPAGLAVLELDEGQRAWEKLPAGNPDRAAMGLTPRHLAYVIYTSGSTGRPKGVMVEHRGVCNYITALQEYCGLGRSDRVLQFSSLNFDASAEEIFGALLCGATLVLRTQAWLSDAQAFWRLCGQSRISVVDLPMRVWQQMTQGRPAPIPAEVRLVIIAGEAVDAGAMQDWLSREQPRPRLLNAYGPTETTMIVTVDEPSSADPVPQSIGRPLANTRIYLLDRHGEPVPVGVAGEICIGGVQVARGYLNRPELTRLHFVPDPFAAGEVDALMYRSGDLGRWLPDGRIEFLGRNDQQVKVRGFRIEPGEIEARLRQHEGVREAAVLAREDSPGDKRLVAYVVGEPGTSPDVASLRQALAQALPEYMVPAAYVVLEALPLTPSGKLDRKALPAPGGAAYAQRAYEAPQGDVETALAETWVDLLQVDRVGRHDHFFELGGHSLLAMRMIARLRQRLGLEVALADLFAQPVLHAFAGAVDRSTASTLPALMAGPRPAQLPLSFAQQRLWLIAQMSEQASAAYNMLDGLRLRGRLDDAALQAALERIVQRHEVLRTHFERVDGQPVQCIAAAAGFTLPRHDLRTAADAPAQVPHWSRIEAREPFDLEHGPLIRGRLLRLGDEDHLLLLTVHHIASDGWSMAVLADEFSALYRAYAHDGVAHHVDPLPALPLQYADYALWQRGWLRGAVLQEQLAFWRDHLRDAPTLLELPTDRPRPAVQDHAGATLNFTLDAPLTRALKALGRRHGSTPYMTLLAGWAALLGRLSGQQDLVIGIPGANRTHAELEPLIGFFVNTLALRVDLSANPSAAQLLQQLRRTTLAAQAHKDVPFQQVVEALRPARSLAHTPLYQVAFAMQNMPEGVLDVPGMQMTPISPEGAAAQTDLWWSVTEVGDRLACTVVFATALFDRATVQRWSGHWQCLLQAMVADDAQPVSRLALLSAAERRQLLVEWNDTRRDYAQERLVHRLFEQQAACQPDAPALSFDGGTLSYAELNARANRLAHHLVEQGVRPDSRVAIALERGPAWVAAMLAVLKAGGAYVPLDPAYPPERLGFMLEDCRARVVLTQAAVQERLPAGRALMAASVLELDAPQAPWLQRPDTNPDPAALGLEPSHLAYVIYTSGSTGQPKGVMVAHANLGNLVAWHCESFPLAPGERTASTAGLAFDASTWELWPALCMGATLALPQGETAGDPMQLLQWWDAQDVHSGFLVTALADLALSRDLPGRQLRTLLTGGDRLGRRPAAPLPFALINNYGPTETTVVATSGRCRHDDAVIHIGRPIANTRIYLLDSHGEPVPVGVAGELCIGGAQVARGYLNQPELTAERFVADPFHGGRMYRSGDLARWLPDGHIEYLGRNDQQVKIRGFRIEPGEVEAQLSRQPGVREAAVLVREDSPGDKRLVAYVVGEPDVQGLRQALAQLLPEYMVPAAYVVLEALPLTPNGKLDRQALPAPEGAAYARRAYEAPQGEAETALAEIWAELLQIDRVGRHDHFFDLGGHSLMAMRMLARLRQRLGLEVALADLFAQPLLQGFATLVSQAGTSTLPAIVPAERLQALPLSFAQQRLWFFAQMGQAASAAYHIPLGLRLVGRLDEGALQAALDRLVQRHEVLRTSFRTIDGQPVQHIAEGIGFTLARHDLAGLAPPQRQAQIEHWSRVEAQQPFDLEAGQPIRGRLLRLEDEEHVLLLTLHHIASDGWSMGVLTGELGALYRAYAHDGVAHQADPLPALPLQYADYAVWQRRWLGGEVLQRQLAYWQEQLGGAPEVIALPTDRPRPAVQDFAGQRLDFELDGALSEALKALSRKHGTTLYMTLLAAWGALLGRLAGQKEVVIGSPVANRTRAEVEPLIGFFVNTLALRLDLGKSPSVGDLLAQVRQRVLQAQGHQDVPFEQVVEALKPVRNLAHSPVFQVMFAWQHALGQAPELGGLDLQALPDDYPSAHFDLTLTLQEEDGRIVGDVEYASALYERGTVERWLGYLKALLQGMVSDDTQAVERIVILGQAERHQMLVQWNDTARDFPRAACVHELFEQQVLRTPQAPAVEYEGKSLSYRELNEQANRLAHHLRGLGVGPDERVAICVRRSPEMMVGILAVLKAGGAYMPLDPGYPSERLQYMLDDSAPRVLLTQAGLCGGPLELAAELAVLELDDGPRSWDLQPAGNPEPAAVGLTPQHLAYVIYTSGSTGQPKGVMIEHRGVCNYLAWAAAYYAPANGSVVSSSLSFDATMTSLYVPLLCGGTVRLVPEGQEIEGLARRLRAGPACGLLKITPSHLDVVGQRLKAAGARSEVEVLVAGGEALPASTVALWRGLQPGVRIINEYGPTETVVGCVVHDVQEVDGRRSVSIGRPIANTRIYILDEWGEPVPAGVSGELYIGGAGVARGYLNRPALTAERFVQERFVDEAGARMYRTGDLARWQPDGTAEYLGRNDFQVKLRGFRIELGEIEARLEQHEGVRKAVVVARADGAGDKRLVAYVVGEPRRQPDAQDLRQALAKVLPEYMVPAAYVLLEALPLTSNGKLDRQALPAPEGAAYAQRAYEAPQGEVEKALAETWGQLLQLDRVGRLDHFFELGGHSLLAIRMIARLRQRLGLEVALVDLFAQPVLHAFAGVVGRAADSVLPTLVAGQRPAVLPLSFAQQRLWFIAQMSEQASATYNMPCSLRLAGRLDEAALQAALQRIVQRHEVLRTHFELVDGQPVQCIAAAGFTLQRHDLRTASDAPAQVTHWSRFEMREPFDLARGPLMRGRLLRLGDEEHVLLLTLHHIASDGWSMGVLTDELSALYRAYAHDGVAHQDDPLPALPLQYADYALWQRRWLGGAVLQEQLAFWRSQLRDAPTLLELPTDRPRPAVQDPAGTSLSFTLDAPLSAALRALSRRHGTTLYMTLLAGWAALLGRLSGQQDLVIGTPMVNRGHAELEPLIGFFLNTLALRMDLSGDPSVAQLLQQVRATTLAAQAHKDLPFEQVVEALNPVRSLAHAPLYQCVFVMQNTPEGRLDLPGLQATPLEPPDDTAQGLDLWWAVAEVGECLECTAVFASALFDRATVQRWSGHWRHLLQAMVADEAQPVSRLALLSAAERRQQLVEWNDTRQPGAQMRCIHELFEQQAARQPDAPALSFDGGTLSYAELNARANRLAHHLVAQGVRPDSRVAIALARGPDLVVAMLAVLKAGGAYVPLDPAYPPERLGFMLEDCRARVVLTQAAVQERLPAGRALMTASVLELDAPQAPWLQRPDTNPDPAALGLKPAHLAYVIYTSGSTGQPKGVMVEHRNICNEVGALQRRYGLEAHDRVLQFVAVAFDVCAEDILGTLAAGATLVLRSAAWLDGAAAFWALCRSQGVRAMSLPAQFWEQLALESQQEEIPAGVKRITVGGEAPGERVMAAWFNRAGHRPRLFNAYGPTEAAVTTSLHECRPDEGRPSIGRPIANARIYLLDAHQQPVPLGVAGELCIGGAGVARGYLNQPELTAQRFVEDPFHGGRMYRSGDLARYRANGEIEFLGRRDQQVKIRGFRIEPGEIEARLAGQPGVREAVVLAREDSPGDKRLVAYVVGEPGTPPDVQELRQALAQVLPEYMVPAAYVVLEALPLTPNGKLDRQALPAPEGVAHAQREYEAPQGEVETALAATWAELLQLDRVGRHDDFFALGGHSLLAVKLIGRLRSLGLHAEIRSLFVHPTLAALARTVTQAHPAGPQGADLPYHGIPPGCTAITADMLPLVKLEPGHIERIVAAVPGGAANVQDIYPLTPLQEGMLFHHLLQPQRDPYLGTLTLAFDSRERLEGYVQALQQVIDRHDILRTGVLWEGLPQPVQVVWRQAPIQVEMAALPEGDAAARLGAHVEAGHLCLDVRRAPMMRGLTAFDPQHRRWLLLLMQHHLVNDATSESLLLQEIALIQAGRAQELPAPVPFRRFVAQARLATATQAHEAFFRQMLGDVDQPTTPFGLLDVQGDGADVHEARCFAGPQLSLRLRRQAQALGVGAASLFHWAWAQVLARTTGQDDVVFGTVLLGRMHGSESADGAIGLLINTLPVRLRLGGMGVRDSIRQTHQILAQLVQHEHASLTLAQRCSALPATTPLFSALLNYRGDNIAAVDWDGLSGSEWGEGVELLAAHERTNYPFCLLVDDFGNDFRLSTLISQPVSAQRVCDYVLRALDGLADALEQAPQTPAWQIDVLGEAERSQLLRDLNDTRRAYPDGGCVHQLFERQAARTPTAVAVQAEGGSLSYRELNEQANRLARHLRLLGVGPDERVALCLPRSLEMVVGLLAVLKAGGAYVPLEPSYPPERLAGMLRDCAPVLLLTQSGLNQTADLPVLALDGPQRPWERLSAGNLAPSDMGLAARHLAYVIYTSGSTGQPKGAMNEHRGVVNRLLWMQQAYGLEAQDAVLQKTPFSFDVSVWEFFWPLSAGARLVMARPEGHKDPAYLADTIGRHGITTLHFVPSMLRTFMDSGQAARCQGLRRVVCSGEALSGSLARRFRRDLPQVDLHNLYGPTEAAVDVTAWTCEGEELPDNIPIGRPIANTQIHLLDRQGQLVPQGVTGELHIAGVPVGRGYLNRPELTLQCFVPDPFAGGDARMYKTGDLARWRPDGLLEYLGRNDQQVKIRGLRIEPGEVEAQLSRQPGVRDAVVLAREDSPGDKRLVAYVVGEPGMQPGTPPDVASLRQALAQVLPESMVPAAYVMLEALPQTPNGKLDRQALPAPEAAAHAQREYEAPQGDTENRLARLWADLLKLDRVGRQDHFFDLGGHSLLVIQLISRTREEWHLDLTPTDVFSHPTLSELSGVIVDRGLSMFDPAELQALMARNKE